MEITALTNPSQLRLDSQQEQILGKDDFLKILVTQLRNQDPIDPVNADEFAVQLAEFSSVEQLQNINSALESNLQSDLLLNQAINNTLATTLIGNNVKALGNSINITEGEDAVMHYRLLSPAEKINIQITDLNGVVIRTLELSGGEAGDHSISWDSKDDSGNQVPEGIYNFSVDARDVDGNNVDAVTFITGLINSIRYNNGNAMLLIGNIEVGLAEVFEIGLDPENSEGKVTRVSL